MKRSANNLATFCRLGIASAEQMNALAEETTRIATTSCKVACRQHRLRPDDVQDVAQEIVIKSIMAAGRWDLRRSSWQTYVSVIARSAIGDQGRRYQRDARLSQALSEGLVN